MSPSARQPAQEVNPRSPWRPERWSQWQPRSPSNPDRGSSRRLPLVSPSARRPVSSHRKWDDVINNNSQSGELAVQDPLGGPSQELKLEKKFWCEFLWHMSSCISQWSMAIKWGDPSWFKSNTYILQTCEENAHGVSVLLITAQMSKQANKLFMLFKVSYGIQYAIVWVTTIPTINNCSPPTIPIIRTTTTGFLLSYGL